MYVKLIHTLLSSEELNNHFIVLQGCKCHASHSRNVHHELGDGRIEALLNFFLCHLSKLNTAHYSYNALHPGVSVMIHPFHSCQKQRVVTTRNGEMTLWDIILNLIAALPFSNGKICILVAYRELSSFKQGWKKFRAIDYIPRTISRISKISHKT